jgi:mRNA-degrading endonuclease RelE of RelBE toxin-antitoxin system
MEHESFDKKSEDQPALPETQPVVQIDLTPEFQKNLRDLGKRYRHIRSDIKHVTQDLEVGNFVGDRVTGIGDAYIVLKVRVQNRDIQKGKRAGYRLIYQVESPTSVLLLTIYAKSDQSDIPAHVIREILGEFNNHD